MGREDRRVASGEHGDLRRRGLVDAAGDRALERRDAARRGHLREPLELVRVVRAHVDPRPAGRAVLRADPRGRRRRCCIAAGDGRHVITHFETRGDGPRRGAGARARGDQASHGVRIPVVDRQGKSRAQQARSELAGRDCRGRRSRPSCAVAPHGRLALRRLRGAGASPCTGGRARRPRRARRRGRAPVGGITCPSSQRIGSFSRSAWMPSQRPMPSRIRKFGRACGQLDVGGADDGPAVQVRCDLRVVRLRHPGDLLAFQQPADAPEVHLQDRRRARLEHARELVFGGQPLARGDRDGRRARDPRHLLGRLGRSRLLEPERIEALEPPRQADRPRDRELPVRPEQQVAARADGVADLPDVALAAIEISERRLPRIERRVRPGGIELDAP